MKNFTGCKRRSNNVPGRQLNFENRTILISGGPESPPPHWIAKGESGADVLNLCLAHQLAVLYHPPVLYLDTQ